MKKLLAILFLGLLSTNVVFSNEYFSIGVNEDKIDFNFECIDKETPDIAYNFGFKNIDTSSMPKYMADGNFIKNKLHFLRKSLNTNKYKVPSSRVYDLGVFNYEGVKYLNLKMFYRHYSKQMSDGKYLLARHSLLLNTNLEYQLETSDFIISKELFEILQKNTKERIDLIKRKEFDLAMDNVTKYTDIIFDFIQQGKESDIDYKWSFKCKKV